MAENWQAGGSLGDVLEDLAREGHLTQSQMRAILLFMYDLKTHHGSTAGLVGKLDERVSTSFNFSRLPQGVRNVESFARLSKLFQSLHAHERDFLSFLVRSRELPRGGLGDWGRMHSAYSNAKQSRAFAVGQVRSLAQTIAEAVYDPKKECGT